MVVTTRFPPRLRVDSGWRLGLDASLLALDSPLIASVFAFPAPGPDVGKLCSPTLFWLCRAAWISRLKTEKLHRAPTNAVRAGRGPEFCSIWPAEGGEHLLCWDKKEVGDT